MLAMPHMNGCTPAYFKSQGREVYELGQDIKNRIVEALTEILHGRSYQHLPPEIAAKARESDLAMIRRWHAMADEMIEQGLEMYRIGEEMEKRREQHAV